MNEVALQKTIETEDFDFAKLKEDVVAGLKAGLLDDNYLCIRS